MVPPDAVSMIQTLGLWLPGDTRLLWQLGELARVAGDNAAAAAILDGCVTEMGLNHPVARQHRLRCSGKKCQSDYENSAQTMATSERREGVHHWCGSGGGDA